MDRAFSSLTVRTVSEDARVIEGVASTPRMDRVGDIVEPLGAEWQMPIPFLLDHDHKQAAGEVESADATDAGIRFRARIFKPADGAAKEICDRAWSLIRNGLRRYVSIGFRPIDWVVLPAGGVRFRVWELLEISAVAVPAQPDARIESLKGSASQAGGVVRLPSKRLSLYDMAIGDKLVCDLPITQREKAIVRALRREHLRFEIDRAEEEIRRVKLGLPSKPTRVLRLNDQLAPAPSASARRSRVVRL